MSSPEGSTDVYRLLAEDIDANGARPDGDVWERIVHLVDPTELRPKLADDIEIRVFEQRTLAWYYGLRRAQRDGS